MRVLIVEDDETIAGFVAKGLREGDVIEQVNRKPVSDVSELRAAVKASGAKPALFLVTRRGESLYLTVEAPRA